MNLRITTLLILLTPPLFALTLTPEALEQETRRAVIEATVFIEDLQTVDDSNFGYLTYASAQIETIHQTWADESQIPLAGHRVLLQLIGGEKLGRGIRFSGYPIVNPNYLYRVRLARVPNQTDTFEMVGFDHFFTPVDRNGRSLASRNRVDGSQQSGTGAYLFWPDRFLPIPYYISAPTFKGHSNYLDAIDASFATWRNETDTKIDFLAMGCTTQPRNENDGINNIILVTEHWPFANEAIAVTRNFYISEEGPYSGAVIDSDILLNGAHFRFSTDQTPNTHDIQNILTHEIGHFLGFGHEIEPKDTNAVMYEVAAANEIKKRTLKSNDLQILNGSYSGFRTRQGSVSTVCAIEQDAVSCASAPKNSLGSKMPVGAMITLIGWILALITMGRISFHHRRIS